MRTLLRDNLDQVFGLFDVLWIGFAIFAAWRIPRAEEREPTVTPPAPAP